MFNKVSLLKKFLFFIFLIPLSICFAAPPDDVAGKLIFLGVNHDSTRSVWLSVTSAAGSFRLEAQGNQIIDEWSKDARGMQVSLSPIVSQGNGGTHFLINASNNRKLDSQNQSGGMVFPPFPTVPPDGPPVVGEPVFPTNPIVIPPETGGGGSGIPTHPIVIPPETPGEPGSPTHPIVLPPGTSPEEGQPSSPTNPSEYPSTTSGETGTTTKSLPGKHHQTRPSSSKLRETRLKHKKKHVTARCLPLNNNSQSTGYNQSAPITEARQFNPQANWNVWSDNYYYGIKDNRHDLDSKGYTTNFVVGADRRITNTVVAGLMFNAMNFVTTAFEGALENKLRGFSAGPYFGYQITPQWSTDGSLAYGQLQNNNKIAILTSQYVTQLFNGTLHATGVYQCGQFQLRPQPLISYTHFRNPTYDFTGVIAGQPIQLTREKENFNFGYTEFKVEGNYTIETRKGDIFQPYTELGVDYAFVRPNDGQIYSGNLTLASTSPVVELATLGLRTLFSKKLLIQTSGSYLSFGQNGLDVWNVRLLASYSFS